MDFLRSIAILMVVLAHSVLAYGAPAYIAPLQLGGIGVDLFFVLSGWLLGGQLFKEVEKSNKVDIKRFWIRRWMRTLPAYYAVLTLSILQQYISVDNVTFPWEYFVFLQNYNEDLSFFSISWSLCVEEQFYLFIAPFIGGLCLKDKKVTTIGLLILLLVPYFSRELSWYSDGYSPTHLQMDCCIFGVLLAQIKTQYKSFWQTMTSNIATISVITFMTLLLFFVARYYPNIGLKDPDNLLLAFIFGSWVVLANSSDAWKNKLYFPGANYIATRSYGIYLLHPEALSLLKRLSLDINFFLYFVLAFLGTVLLSETLYRIIEKPFMDAREKFAISKSTTHA
ncbi:MULTISPECIES: acyltransferase [unclassified Colwellia]|uniref:acyltransferase family protein n=1 Tax=unclassified Colwellia TaxID=196834 RepID=UPI0015F554F1|nr:MULTISPECIES: acyltransferase [unclassified Colwellia]MBA6377932.1 acyltransferase [Colwellia sp. BRX10-7]MBA6387602.1 acyltransferase [Colwellia sp. BRX10-2]MBA6400940.1 acyltransferase [Colwellia sp. BRX10-5]MBA6404784.1 acyltransferase [Colwellia sp. BRX10-1]